MGNCQIESGENSPQLSMNAIMTSYASNQRIGTARERTIQAVEYYNNNVLRARVGAGLAGTRASVSERHLMQTRSKTGNLYGHNTENLYRSNSSLELLHDHVNLKSDLDSNQIVPGGLRREYGSHGSIHVISSDRRTTTGESFFAMLQDYRPAVLNVIGVDQRSPGPDEYLKGKINENNQQLSSKSSSAYIQNHTNHQGNATETANCGNSSPKLLTKLHKIWGPTKQGRLQNSEEIAMAVTGQSSGSHNSLGYDVNVSSVVDIEERQRRQSFAHYDCQSLTANLIYAAKLRSVLLARRRNTTTGASAASLLNSRASTPDGAKSVEEDFGDGQNNELLESCPYFRNEIGGEKERNVSITRINTPNSPGQNKKSIHIPVLACGLSILECGIGETLWKPTTCPFQGGTRPIEYVDCGAKYYRHYFLGQGN